MVGLSLRIYPKLLVRLSMPGYLPSICPPPRTKLTHSQYWSCWSEEMFQLQGYVFLTRRLKQCSLRKIPNLLNISCLGWDLCQMKRQASWSSLFCCKGILGQYLLLVSDKSYWKWLDRRWSSSRSDIRTPSAWIPLPSLGPSADDNRYRSRGDQACREW